MGGSGLRGQVRCTPTAASLPYASLNTSDASCPSWASIYTTNQGAQYGAQFIMFNVDGNPKKARSYFKNISGQIIDDFTIFADCPRERGTPVARTVPSSVRGPPLHRHSQGQRWPLTDVERGHGR